LKVSWFSAGVSSAVATWLVRKSLDRIIYCHLEDQHEDTMRFVRDCEAWFERPVEILQSPLKSVDGACRARNYVNGPRWASCTWLLKAGVRKEWEASLPRGTELVYVWGFDAGESHRAERLRETMPDQEHEFPLIDQFLLKAEAHAILERAGIKRPAMYDLGYNNNNCVGCVKGGAGYWNKIRVDFPEVFAARAAMERAIGGTCLSGVYLDELDPSAGRKQAPVVAECGIACEMVEDLH
jgi:hypothetical protein